MLFKHYFVFFFNYLPIKFQVRIVTNSADIDGNMQQQSKGKLELGFHQRHAVYLRTASLPYVIRS